MSKFFAHLMNESCDHYYIQFEANQKPVTTDEWWTVLLKSDPTVKHEIDLAQSDGEGDGICGTYLYVRHCEEIR